MELQRGLNIHSPFIELLDLKVYVSVKCHGYTFQCSVVNVDFPVFNNLIRTTAHTKHRNNNSNFQPQGANTNARLPKTKTRIFHINNVNFNTPSHCFLKIKNVYSSWLYYNSSRFTKFN